MKHCDIHGDRPRPDLCDDCRRTYREPAAPLPQLRLTDSLQGQFEIVLLPKLHGSADRIIVRPVKR